MIMKKRDTIFVLVFIVCLFMTSFFLGSSITGYFVSTDGVNSGGNAYLYAVAVSLIIIIGMIYFIEKRKS
jgi:Na+/melibiose symporter-like transporter